MSLLVDMADAVLAELSGATLSMPFTAERAYFVVRELAAPDGVRVSVVPVRKSTRAFDLKLRQEHHLGIEIWVHAKARPLPAECDPLMQLVEDIEGLFLPGTQVASPRSQVIGTEYMPIYSHERLDELRMFTAGITITFKLTR